MAEETRAAVRELERVEIPWVVAYLREDLQDLRNDVRRLDTKIDGLRDDIDARFDAMNGRIDGLRKDIDAKIDGLRKDMDAGFDELRQEMGGYVRWMITTMVAVGALIVAAIKASSMKRSRTVDGKGEARVHHDRDTWPPHERAGCRPGVRHRRDPWRAHPQRYSPTLHAAHLPLPSPLSSPASRLLAAPRAEEQGAVDVGPWNGSLRP